MYSEKIKSLNSNIDNKIYEYEFSPSGLNLKIENHIKSNINHTTNNLNKAELIAFQQEQIRIEEENQKKRKIEENNKKIKENLKKKNASNKQIEVQNQQKKFEEKEIQKQKLEKFHKELKQKNIKKNQKNSLMVNIDSNLEEQNLNEKHKININNNNKDFATFSFHEIENEIQNPPIKTAKANFNPNINKDFKENDSVVDIREDIDSLIKRKLDQVKNGTYNNEYYNNINQFEFSERQNYNEENISFNKEENFTSNTTNNLIKMNSSQNIFKKNQIQESLSDISSISHKKQIKEYNYGNKENNLFSKSKNFQQNNYNPNNIVKPNQQSLYKITSNIPNVMEKENFCKINDSALSDFSSDNDNNTRKILIKNNINKSKDKNFTENKINLKSTNSGNKLNFVKNKISEEYLNTENSKFENINNQKADYSIINNNNTFNANDSFFTEENIKSVLNKNINDVKNFRKSGTMNQKQNIECNNNKILSDNSLLNKTPRKSSINFKKEIINKNNSSFFSEEKKFPKEINKSKSSNKIINVNLKKRR